MPKHHTTYSIILGRCLQHRGGEPEQAKGADGMQLFVLDCIAYIVDAETDWVYAMAKADADESWMVM